MNEHIRDNNSGSLMLKKEHLGLLERMIAVAGNKEGILVMYVPCMDRRKQSAYVCRMNSQAQSVEFSKGPRARRFGKEGKMMGFAWSGPRRWHYSSCTLSSSCDAAYRHQSARELKAVVWNAIAT